MAIRDDNDNRFYPPTPLRLAEARRKGQVARSADLAGVLTAGGGVMLLCLAGGRMLGALTYMTASLLEARPGAGPGLAETGEALWPALWPVLAWGGLFLAAMIALAALAAFVQVGPLAAPENVRADFSRLSPSEGLRRLLSPRTCVRTALALAKIGVVCGIGYAAIRSDLPRIVRAPRLAPRQLAGEAGALAAAMGLKIAAALLVLGILDFLYQRWQFRREMRMTRSELLADMRQMEGDPTVRRRRKELGRARRREQNDG